MIQFGSNLSDPLWCRRGFLLFGILSAGTPTPTRERWDFLFRLLEDPDLKATEIPQIRFQRSDASKKVLDAMVSDFRYEYGTEGFWRFLDFLSFALGFDVDPRTNDEVGSKFVKRFFAGDLPTPALLAVAEYPWDYLGQMYTENIHHGGPGAFFPTPHEVCEAKVQMAMHDCRDPYASVMDPCAGTGRLLLHASNMSLNLHAQDIDAVALKILKINGALFAPWLVAPPPNHRAPCPVPAKDPVPSARDKLLRLRKAARNRIS